MLNQTSEFLILLEVIEDLLERIELYFGISCDRIMEKLKQEGAENRKGTWVDCFSSLLKKTTSYALRKGSRVVQNTGWASMLSPAFAMLTWAIIGGSSTLPWKGGIDIKSLLIPLVAFTVPFMLDSMAETIEKSDFKVMLRGWAEQF